MLLVRCVYGVAPAAESGSFTSFPTRKRGGFEHGFIGAEMIKKYAPSDDYSVFMCGAKAMYDFEER